MNPVRPDRLPSWVTAATGAASARVVGRVQELWSGYGEIVRVALEGGAAPAVILKRVAPPDATAHPRGWGGSRSDTRKRASYAVEARFYAAFAPRLPPGCRVPRLLDQAEAAGERWLLLEDLDAAGYPGRRGRLTDPELAACLGWLAAFHAAFLGVAPDGLWPAGSYWHLATRPDERAAMAPGPLRDAAGALDARLRAARYQTLVHGDAKPANFCFAEGARNGPGAAPGPGPEAGAPVEVAAVDFQYVGRAPGVVDVVYLLGAAVADRDLPGRAPPAIDAYFAALARELVATAARAGKPPPTAAEVAAVEAEWRDLVDIAWADFERFLAGWAPGHPKRGRYAAARVRAALARLG